jgi:hypothetical protein
MREIAHAHPSPPSNPLKIGIVWPGRTWTIAFFQRLVFPEV